MEKTLIKVKPKRLDSILEKYNVEACGEKTVKKWNQIIEEKTCISIFKT